MRVLTLVIALLLSTAAAAAQPEATAVQRKEAGNHYLKQRQYQSARDQYLAALQIDPSYADAHYNLGVVYFFRLHEYPRALYHFVSYARLRPDASDLNQVRALSAQALERIEAEERKVYADVLRIGTISALEAFLDANPVGPYAADAKNKTRLLLEYQKAQRHRDAAIAEAYQRAQAKTTPAAMAEFLRRYPDAPQAAEAEHLQGVWAEQLAADKKAFLAAVETGTPTALEAFLQERPKSAYAPEARKQVQQLRAAEESVQLAAADRDWEVAVATGTTASYRAFLGAYPDDPRAREAGERATVLEAETRVAAERAEADRLWEAVDAENSAATFRDFAVAYPTHLRAEEATRRAGALEASAAAGAAAAAARQKENQAWNTAKSEDTVVAYERFVTTYPEHRKVDAAWKRITVLKEEMARAAAQAAEERVDRAWRTAATAGAVAAYQAFLAEYPEHARADRARREIEKLRQAEAKAAARAAREKADRAWKGAAKEGTVSAYEAFLAAYPQHPKAGRAQREIDGIREQEAAAAAKVVRDQADRAWKEANKKGTLAAYETFLAAHPQHRKAGRARREIDEIREQEAAATAKAARDQADRAWKTADQADTVAAYEEFIAAYPGHSKADNAERRLKELQDAAAAAQLRGAADRAWDAAEQADTGQGYEQFYRRHPDHRQAEEARRRAAAMAAASNGIRVAEPPTPPIATQPAVTSKAETTATSVEQAPEQVQETAWADARETDTVEAYQQFVRQHPDAEQVTTAKSRLEELQRGKQEGGSSLSRSRRKALQRYRRMLVEE